MFFLNTKNLCTKFLRKVLIKDIHHCKLLNCADSALKSSSGSQILHKQNHHVLLRGRKLFSRSSQPYVFTSHQTFYSTISIKKEKSGIKLTQKDVELTIPYLWLRDHCRSEKFYNASTNQKNPDFSLMSKDVNPNKIELSKDEKKINITWRDGHESSFAVSWLQENVYPGRFSRGVQKQLWRAEDFTKGLPRVSLADHMAAGGPRRTLAHLLQYGFCLVDGVEVSIDATQAVMERVAPIMPSLFGGMWTFAADGTRDDTAYDNTALGAHTDMTYMDLPAGIQSWQCLHHDGGGGETLLVDGHRAVEGLRAGNPDCLAPLQWPVPHEYKEAPSENSPGYHLYSLQPVVRLHPASREVISLRYNPYDRAPLNSIAPEDQEEFYNAYEELGKHIADKSGELWVKLRPGMVLLVDNWCVMHGRSAFTGHRKMCGCYLGRDDWISKARMMGLL